MIIINAFKEIIYQNWKFWNTYQLNNNYYKKYKNDKILYFIYFFKKKINNFEWLKRKYNLNGAWVNIVLLFSKMIYTCENKNSKITSKCKKWTWVILKECFKMKKIESLNL